MRVGTSCSVASAPFRDRKGNWPMQFSSIKRLLPVAALLAGVSGHAALTIPGADGSDGPLNVTNPATVIDLGQAVPGGWNASNAANAGKGIYDAAKWAVVYKYSSVNVPAGGYTVTFKNHPSNAPVVWLVSGDVTIGSGSVINLIGQAQVVGIDADRPTEPGPGGFRGGAAGSAYSPAGPGFGPGAGPTYSSFGTKGTDPSGPVYGNPQILPLIGGSGGGGVLNSVSGGAGGGAILIAATGTITVNGYIQALGGSGSYPGSGGAIRLVGDTITTAAYQGLNALAGGSSSAGGGRIRLEANAFSLQTIVPAPSTAPPAVTPVIFPPSQPQTTITKVDALAVSGDPQSAFAPTNPTVVNIAKTTAAKITIAAANVPVAWNVTVRSAPRNGAEVIANAVKISGDDTASVWTADIVLPLGYNALQVRAVKP
jgi:hypothetical protein